jgi:Arc/MetJ-type ribon-helix-helix transcriptional regulator
MKKRPVTVVLDDGIEQRITARRAAGKRIRSFSDVTREALSKGLDALDQEPPANQSISSATRFVA